MEALKTNKDVSSDLFLLFCSRKLVSAITSMGLSFEECMVSENGESLLYNLATDPRYCDKFLKPFVNLAMETFLLHRLAFQFQPPARIFRYAYGTSFDPIHMENAVFIDDDDSDKELHVGCMLVPGFQVGATIVKCTVYLVPGSMISITQTTNRNDWNRFHCFECDHSTPSKGVYFEFNSVALEHALKTWIRSLFCVRASLAMSLLWKTSLTFLQTSE